MRGWGGGGGCRAVSATVVTSNIDVNQNACCVCYMKQFYGPFFQDLKFEEPVRVLSPEEKTKFNLRYYNSHIHRASFCLPEFARKVSVCAVII